MTADLFARYAFPPNELGYCGPPDSAGLLSAPQGSEVLRHARGFDGAWPYLEEIAEAAGLDPLDPEVVHSYWVGGPLLHRVDGPRLLHRLRTAMSGQPSGLLSSIDDDELVLAHHSFHVLVVYPWLRFLDADPVIPMRILQSCRIRWGVVSSANDEHVVIESAPLEFDGRLLHLGATRPETVRWRRGDTVLAPRPQPGQTVTAHWGWVCDTVDQAGRDALVAATETTLALVNDLHAVERRHR